MKYNLYNVFYSILDLILLKLTTAEIKLMVSGEYGFDPFEFLFLYGMRKYSQMKTDSTFFFFYICLSNIFFGHVSSGEGNKSKNTRNGTTSN